MQAETIRFQPITHKSKIKIWQIAILAILVSLIITAVSIYLSPIGQRWQANQTAQVPVVGATEIELRSDPLLSHVFAPAVTEVTTGTTITWHFNEVDEDGEAVEHNVVFDDMASPVQTTGTYSRQFNEPGTYLYRCTLHPFMDGSVVVTAQ